MYAKEACLSRTVYQAGPLFSVGEKAFHRILSAALEKEGHEVIFPGALLSGAQIELAGPTAKKLIFDTCRDALERADCVVALLDGPQVDDGTAWEIGYAHARGLPIYGIRTDSRLAGDTQYSRVNSMIEGCLSGLTDNIELLLPLLLL
jgi:nucleoside 2-deoxyribosyltransferase